MERVQKPFKKIIVTIDGPAGAGKTTISKLLADKLGYRYLDTGALYRAVAVAATDRGIAVDDDLALESLCRDMVIDLRSSADGLRVLVNQDDVTGRLRTPQISMMASAVSARSVVRRFLLTVQRQLGEQKGVVAEGRDMGTVVFPQAEAKFFLDADPHIRARRRHEELIVQKGERPSLESVEKQMLQRDHNDSTRSLAPLQPAEDAVRIDSTHLTLDQVIHQMLDYIEQIQ
ncbi:MAG: (d)CMP kinase [Desulfobacteraceae bacterium]|nr:(d)CMP kinase [Desulfobacteraceae bacterium]